jgi:hypothetical protein
MKITIEYNEQFEKIWTKIQKDFPYAYEYDPKTVAHIAFLEGCTYEMKKSFETIDTILTSPGTFEHYKNSYDFNTDGTEK